MKINQTSNFTARSKIDG